MSTQVIDASSLSTLRRVNLKSAMNHGDLKRVSEVLNRKPNYLSQLFSLKSARKISDDLARKVESVLGLEKYRLDTPIESLLPLIKVSHEDRATILNAVLSQFDQSYLRHGVVFDFELPYGAKADIAVLQSNTNPFAVIQTAELDATDLDVSFIRDRLFSALLLSKAPVGALVVVREGKFSIEAYRVAMGDMDAIEGLLQVDKNGQFLKGQSND